MKRRLRFRAMSILIGLLDRLEALHNEPCNAYGGFSVQDGKIRLCSKKRWHTDSHAYDWQPL